MPVASLKAEYIFSHLHENVVKLAICWKEAPVWCREDSHGAEFLIGVVEELRVPLI